MLKEINSFPEYFLDTETLQIISKRRRHHKVLRPVMTVKGYLRVKLRKNKKNIDKYLHRIIAEVFLGKCPDNLQVNHKNGIKTDNRPDNLEYVTGTENIRHSYKIGLRKISGVALKSKLKKFFNQEPINAFR